MCNQNFSVVDQDNPQAKSKSILIILSLAFSFFTTHAFAYTESPMILEADPALPSVEMRLPENPLQLNVAEVGKYTPQIDILMGKEKDIRRMVVYGYSRLVGYNQELKLVADIVERFENDENKKFTFHLRKGMKWSDGAPFTSDDFKFFWEDIATNEEVNKFGIPSIFLINGQAPEVSFPDLYTVIYEWQQPNPFFLPSLAAPSPNFIYQPKHYLKKYHANYGDREKLEAKAKDKGKNNWVAVYLGKARQYKLTNPDLPSLDPWLITNSPPAERYEFVRNPYFHRVDQQGQQLPYADRVIMYISAGSLIPAKTGAGESDLQAQYLQLNNYTFLKAGEKNGNYQVRLWQTTRGAHKALYPNLNSNDSVWRELVRDVRFRRALSMGVNRHEINQVIYFGLASESNNTVIEACPLYSEDLRMRWANYDIQMANALLDEMGLTERDDRGIRLRPDGEPLEVIVQTAGEDTEETDILELVRDSWSKIGIKMYSKPSQREVFRDRIFSGDTMMSIWSGIENGIPTADMSPEELAPTHQDQYQWPKWGQYVETNQEVGEQSDIPEVLRLSELYENWTMTKTYSEQRDIWQEMLAIHQDQIFTIGIINNVPQPVVVNNNLRNVPQEGVFAWSPTAYFGVYHPDTFWLDVP